MFKSKKEKFLKELGPLWGKVVCDEEDFIPSKPLIVINKEELSETRLLLEHAGMPRKYSIECAKEYIEKGKTSCIINKYGDALVCMSDDNKNFLYRVERNELK